MPIELFISAFIGAFGLYLFTCPEGALLVLGAKLQENRDQGKGGHYVFCGLHASSRVALAAAKWIGFTLSLIAMTIAVVFSLMENGELLRIIHLI